MKRLEVKKGIFTFLDDEDFERFFEFPWQIKKSHSGKLYVYRIDQKVKNYKVLYRKIKYLAREILSVPRGFEADHINGNTLDNRKRNLRLCTKEENLMNKNKYRNNSTGVKGVVYRSNHGEKCWRTQISVGGRTRRIGDYLSKNEATQSYNIASQRFYGEFANPN